MEAGMTISKQKRLVRLGAASVQTRADRETGMLEQIPEYLWDGDAVRPR